MGLIALKAQMGIHDVMQAFEPMTLRYCESAISMFDAQLQSAQRLGLILRWGATEIMRLTPQSDENILFAGVFDDLIPCLRDCK